MVKKVGSICSEDEESKNIPNCEHSIGLLWILQDHYLKLNQETNKFWLPLIITQSGARQKL